MVCVCFACMLLWSLMLARIHFQRCLSFSTPPSLMMISDDSDKAEFNGSYVGDYYPNDNTRLKYFSPLEFHTHSIGEGLCCSYSGISSIMFYGITWFPSQPKVAVRTYAVRVLPLADYTMINSINPVIVILMLIFYHVIATNGISKGIKECQKVPKIMNSIY